MDTQGTPASGPAPVMSTAEALAEVAATLPKASVPAGQTGAPAGATDGTTANPAETGSPAEGEKKTEAKPADSEAARLARIAKEQRRLDADRKAFEAQKTAEAEKHKATIEKAARWDRFEEAKTKSGRVAALKELYEEGEITGELYGELTDHVIASSKVPTQEEILDRKLQEKLDAAKKASADEAQKAADAAAAAQATQIETLETKFIEGLGTTLEAAPTRWPLVNHLGVSGRDILAYLKAQHEAGKPIPSREDVLNHFEQDFDSKIQKAKPAETKPSPSARTVTNDWKSDAVVKPGGGSQTIEEITIEAKRAAGVIK